jgi:hypothetical protein
VIWVVVFGGIAVAGLAMVVSYAVWLFHKASDVMSEVRVLFDQGDQLVTLVGQIEVPQLAGLGDGVDSERMVRGEYVAGVGK